jgi:hypothetical protein
MACYGFTFTSKNNGILLAYNKLMQETNTMAKVKAKGKATPLQAWTGP